MKRMVTWPILGRVVAFAYRVKTGLPQSLTPFRRFLRWLATSNEHTNYTYDLSTSNRRHLAAFVAHVSGSSYRTALGYIDELDRDQALRQHVRNIIRNHEDGRFADADIRFGRRLGWYALIRILKPRVVVETGVDKGLGACVITAALMRNASEGDAGRYFGTDINPRKGYLLTGEYARHGQILYGDSIESLRALTDPIDLFINDSDHSAQYEAREYETIESKLSERAVVLGDNANITDELLKFAERTGRQFLYFAEEPKDHWYRGDGIGAAFRASR
jgi:hypothetical protein